MKRVVVDSSVLLASLFKDGTVRDVLMTAEDALFVAPAYVQSEVERHFSDISARSGIPPETVRAVLTDVLSFVELAPLVVYQSSMAEARDLCRRAHASGDEDFVALALALGAPIWTLDRDFGRISGLQVLDTARARSVLEAAQRTERRRRSKL